MNRDEFFTRVRVAAASGRAHRIHSGPAASGPVGYLGGGEDLCGRLAAEIDAVGGRAEVVADLAAARARLRELLDELRPRSALCWEHPLLDRLGLAEALHSAGVSAWRHAELAKLAPEAQRERMLACDVGITSCGYAIAESGTLAMLSAPGRERSASLVPPVSIAVIEAGQILPDLFDLFAALQAAGTESLPSNLTLITGPSKTGDLELKLTTGVHGPGVWRAIIIRRAE